MSIALAGIDPPLRIVPLEPMSLDEFWHFSAENPELRLEREPNGDVVLMSPTLGGAGVRSTSVIGQLFIWAEKDGSGYALDSSTGCQLPDGSVRSADAAWIGAKRWTVPNIEDDAPVPCPDFVVEVRSKSDRLKPAQAKMLAWIANGVELAWLVDPHRKVVEIYRPGQAVEVQEGHTAVYGEGPVSGFVLELARIWI
ncbi:MAG: Uma2 family endonuclease [Acidobacteriota bacterium]|nr:Uma2 family endonuclease [Acidobacteriota bacterium]